MAVYTPAPPPSLPSLGAAVSVHEQMGKTVPKLRTPTLPACIPCSEVPSDGSSLASSLPSASLFLLPSPGLSFLCLNKVLERQSPHLFVLAPEYPL